MNAEVEVGATLFQSSYQPDPASARDVLAFVLAPAEAFTRDPEELEVVRCMLGEAKVEAISRWMHLNKR